MTPPSKFMPRVRRGAGRRAALLLAVLLLYSGSGCYYAHAAWEQARIMAARRPIPDLLRNPAISDSLRRKLALVLEAREFARDHIGLNPGGNFTSYSDVGRDTLLLVLSAARRDTMVGHVWSFPVVGRFPYKGFFDFAAAEREARRLEGGGLDTYLRPSDAFSTLGWFNDPLLSTTVQRDTIDLVNTVIHELTHNTLFVRGRGDFNESFASFVGARGAMDFFAARGSRDAARIAEARWEDEQILAAFWRRLAASIDSVLRATPPGPARSAVRDSAYVRAREELVTEISPRLKTIGPGYARRVVLNNASVLARRVYGRGFDVFEAVYACEGRSLARSVARVVQVADQAHDDPFDIVRGWVNQPSCRALLDATGAALDGSG